MTAGRRKRRVGDVPSRPKRLTPNQIVAFNLTRARTDRGWSQPEAATALEPFLGVRWSRASYSAVERSVDGVRIKQFSADELVAIARCFDRPISWFLTPPAGTVAATPDHHDGLDASVLRETLRSTRTP